MTPQESLDWVFNGKFGRETREEHDAQSAEARTVLQELVDDAERWWPL